MDDYSKAANIYPNLTANISNEQQFRLNKIKDYYKKLKIIF